MSSSDLQRFSFLERLVHWVVGLSFTTLLLTGLAFSYPKLFWLTLLFGGGPAARILHPWIGIVLAMGLVLMFLIWVQDMFLGRADVEWMKAVGHYARHDTKNVPETGKYNAGQKAFFWFQSVLGVVFLVSGIPLWLPDGFAAELLLFMRLIHFVAAMGGGLLLVLHVYLGIVAFPGTARGMLQGSVTRRWAKLHHPLWYREQSGD